MPQFLAYLAPFALLLPGSPPDSEQDAVSLLPEPEEESAPRTEQTAHGWLLLDATTSIPIQHQVRIERRVTIRIAPRSTSRQEMIARLQRPDGTTRVVERNFGRCVPLRSIAAVQTMADNRLLLYLRDRRILSARLEKACRARDYYSGFYVEPNDDGMLCIGRDKLLARSGAKCQLSGLNQTVAVADD